VGQGWDIFIYFAGLPVEIDKIRDRYGVWKLRTSSNLERHLVCIVGLI
jgi:hypothetical protein